MSRIDRFAVIWSRSIIAARWWVILGVTLIVVAAALGMRFLELNTNYRVFFSKENPQLQAFEALQNIYTKTDNVIYVIQPKQGEIFQPHVLQAIQELTNESWKLPYATRVDSVTNFQHTYANEDELIVMDLIEGDPNHYTKEELEQRKKIALSEPLLVDRLIANDARTTGINITMYLPETSSSEVTYTAAAAEELLRTMQAKYPDIIFKLSGIVTMNSAFSTASFNDMKSLVPIMYGVLSLTMLLLLRSFSSTGATLIIIAFSALVAMGLAGWLGIKLTPPSATAPTVILTLAIADSIHIIMSMYKAMQQGKSKRDAIIESFRINLQPVFLTSLTTVIGFLSLNFSDAPPFRDLGNITAIGVTAAFFFSITLLPAVLAVLPLRNPHYSGENRGFMRHLAEFVIANRKPLLWLNLGIVAFCALMIPKIELTDQFVEYFDDTISFREDTDFMMKHLTGIYQIEYSINAKESNGISDPYYLNYLEKYVEWLRSQPEVMNVFSITDIFKRLNKNMHADNAHYYSIPTTREMGAQYLLLYELSLPYGLDLNDRINIDKSASRVTVTLKGAVTTDNIKSFKQRSEMWLKEHTPSYMHTEATSPIVMFAFISQRNIESMINGNIIAFLLISFTIVLALKSVFIGSFSLIPNITPVIVGFGIWALIVGRINMAVAIVAAVSLGIIVDDTIHFLSKYLRARREKGLSSADAVRYAFDTVGTALWVTTFILIAGFSILAFSAFAVNKSMGILTAIMIAVALVADFLFLPPLLMLFDSKKEKTQKKEVL